MPVSIETLSEGLALRQHVREDVPQTHLAKAGTPSMGGIPMLVGVIVAAVAIGLTQAKLTHQTVVCLAAIVAFAMVGLADDLRKLDDAKSKGILARYRVGAEAAMALLLAFGLTLGSDASGTGAHWLGSSWWPEECSLALGVLVMVASANAMNLTDGLDGLASGLTTIAGLALGVAALVLGRGEIAVLSAAIAGAAGGFLLHNYKPAKVWMGDVGSLGLGAGLGAVAVAGGMEFLFVIVGFVFVAEALSVILQVASFKRTGKRIFKMAPLHHHFELCGLEERRVVSLFWAAGACTAIVGLALLWLTLPAA